MSNRKNALTVYISAELETRINKGYAQAVLDGYKGTRQAFLNELINSALTVKECENGRDI